MVEFIREPPSRVSLTVVCVKHLESQPSKGLPHKDWLPFPGKC